MSLRERAIKTSVEVEEEAARVRAATIEMGDREVRRWAAATANRILDVVSSEGDWVEDQREFNTGILLSVAATVEGMDFVFVPPKNTTQSAPLYWVHGTEGTRWSFYNVAELGALIREHDPVAMPDAVNA